MWKDTLDWKVIITHLGTLNVFPLILGVLVINLFLLPFAQNVELDSEWRGLGEDFAVPPVVRQARSDRGKGPPRKALHSQALLFLCN